MTSKSSTRPRRRRIRVAVLAVLGVGAAVAFALRNTDVVEMPTPPGIEGPYTSLSRAEVLDLLKPCHAAVSKLKDYSATLVKQERVKGELLAEQRVFLKLRHQPFSVYLRFLAPDSKKDTQAIYREEPDGGKMWGTLFGFWVPLDPTKPAPGQKYPVTNIGMKNLAARLIRGVEEARDARQPVRPAIRLYKDQRIDGRACECVTIFTPPGAEKELGRLTYVFIDKQTGLLYRYEGYDWSGNKTDPQQLDERYEYRNVKPDQGFGDKDFDTENEEYEL